MGNIEKALPGQAIRHHLKEPPIARSLRDSASLSTKIVVSSSPLNVWIMLGRTPTQNEPLWNA
ncbi:hypothetical protein HUG20_06835 [Salicibibacter cibi]|uniref:Uncharacterized protein n=1 Tax=Salicibibacter cibi TaxID=2743001 RepID=A0A7T6Z9Y3_9BACI|nr:hypothetical protein HUG20_06835 [Salicibibacter cibi]